MPAEQSAKSHTAWDPMTHLIIGPLSLVAFALAIYLLRHDPRPELVRDILVLLLAVALLLLNLKTRSYTLRIQDRVIRLEERLRLASLLAPGELAGSASISPAQLIALRFAPDAELPALVSRTLAEQLTPPQIKAKIESWRPDHARV